MVEFHSPWNSCGLKPLPDAQRLTPFLPEDRKVGGDGFVSWQGSWYTVYWRLVGRVVQV